MNWSSVLTLFVFAVGVTCIQALAGVPAIVLEYARRAETVAEAARRCSIDMDAKDAKALDGKNCVTFLTLNDEHVTWIRDMRAVIEADDAAFRAKPWHTPSERDAQITVTTRINAANTIIKAAATRLMTLKHAAKK